MQAYRVETTVAPDGSVTVKHLPLAAGDAVEVIILVAEHRPASTNRYPLHGKTVIYHDPFGPVGQDDWDIVQ